MERGKKVARGPSRIKVDPRGSMARKSLGTGLDSRSRNFLVLRLHTPDSIQTPGVIKSEVLKTEYEPGTLSVTKIAIGDTT